MDDLKSVTVGYLRELARKHLGPGYSKLKKEELIAELAAHVPALARLARLVGIPVAKKRAPAKKTPPAEAPPARKAARTEKTAPVKKPVPSKRTQRVAVEGQGRVSAPKRVAAKRASEKPGSAPAARPAQVVNFPPKARAPREPRSPEVPLPPVTAAAPEPVPPPDIEAKPPPPPAQHAAEPLVEGFFVARVAGAYEARRHHLLEEQSPRLPPADRSAEFDEKLAPLPTDYGDDTALLLVRDPRTLFLLWDFSDASRAKALRGLESPRAVLKVFDGEILAREQEFALESRSFYFHDLAPGRSYRAEAHFVGRDGRSRRIGPSSNRAMLPPAGVSTDTSVRFMSRPVPEPERKLPVAVPAATAPAFEEREYITWHRVELPGSGGVREIPEVRRERIARVAPPPPGPHLESPPRPPGASDQRYAKHLESPERPLGSSEQQYLRHLQARETARPREYLEVARAPGSSEQSYLRPLEGPTTSGVPRQHVYLEVPRAIGSSEQSHLGSLEGSIAAGARRAHDYLEVARAAGASEQRYLRAAEEILVGGVPRPHGYLEVARPPGASDQRYLHPSWERGIDSVSPYLDVARASGASEQRYAESWTPAPVFADASISGPPASPRPVPPAPPPQVPAPPSAAAPAPEAAVPAVQPAPPPPAPVEPPSPLRRRDPSYFLPPKPSSGGRRS